VVAGSAARPQPAPAPHAGAQSRNPRGTASTLHACPSTLAPTSPLQAQAAKAQDAGRWMAERSIDAQRASATVPRDTAQLYSQLAASGLQYGPAFRLLRNVHVPDAAG
jgi:hypothetical protein